MPNFILSETNRDFARVNPVSHSHTLLVHLTLGPSFSGKTRHFAMFTRIYVYTYLNVSYENRVNVDFYPNLESEFHQLPHYFVPQIFSMKLNVGRNTYPGSGPGIQ